MEDFKILLVDDEKDFVKSLSERLEMRDLNAGVAFDGEQALEAIKKERPSVILLDLKMPGMDGLEVLKLVKQAHPHIQVIILTGHGSEKDEEQARKLGAFDYLQKPVKMDHLLKTLKKAHKKFKHSQYNVDTLLMGAAMAQAGEADLAREVMEERFKEENS
jgi:DNA-binding NtrC family response regulator